MSGRFLALLPKTGRDLLVGYTVTEGLARSIHDKIRLDEAELVAGVAGAFTHLRMRSKEAA